MNQLVELKEQFESFKKLVNDYLSVSGARGHYHREDSMRLYSKIQEALQQSQLNPKRRSILSVLLNEHEN